MKKLMNIFLFFVGVGSGLAVHADPQTDFESRSMAATQSDERRDRNRIFNILAQKVGTKEASSLMRNIKAAEAADCQYDHYGVCGEYYVSNANYACHIQIRLYFYPGVAFLGHHVISDWDSASCE